MGTEPIRILDTGTRRCETIPDGVELRHEPALLREALDVDAAAVGRRLRQPHHLVFYSHFAVATVASRSLISEPERHRFWAVGQRTAQALADRYGITPSFPDDQCFQGLIESLSERAEPLPLLAFGLKGQLRDLSPLARRWDVAFTSIPVYASVAAEGSTLRRAFDEVRPHWLALTSARGAQSVADAVGREKLHRLQSSEELRIAAIGLSTAARVEELGLRADLIPPSPDRSKMLFAIAQTSKLT